MAGQVGSRGGAGRGVVRLVLGLTPPGTRAPTGAEGELLIPE